MTHLTLPYLKDISSILHEYLLHNALLFVLHGPEYGENTAS